MKKIALTFGIIAGMLIIVYMIVIFLIIGDPMEMTASDLDIAAVLGYLRYLILVLTVIFAMRTYRQQLTPPVTYWQIVKAGIAVSAVVGILVGLMELTYVAMNPDFYDTYAARYIQSMRESGASAQDIADFQKSMDNFAWIKSPGMTGLFYFFETALIGSVVSFILGIVFRSRHKPSLAGA